MERHIISIHRTFSKPKTNTITSASFLPGGSQVFTSASSTSCDVAAKANTCKVGPVRHQLFLEGSITPLIGVEKPQLQIYKAIL